jgi:hypothetical protein
MQEVILLSGHYFAEPDFTSSHRKKSRQGVDILPQRAQEIVSEMNKDCVTQYVAEPLAIRVGVETDSSRAPVVLENE